MSPTRHLPLLKWLLAILLAVMALGGAALIQFGGVRGYRIHCEKAHAAACVLQRETSRGIQSWRVPLGPHATAKVQVETYPRSRPRVFLYLHDDTRSVFAAEFEGGDEVARANAAALQLNRVFASATPASVQLEVRPASYMRPLIWAGFGFFVLMALVIWRALFKAER